MDNMLTTLPMLSLYDSVAMDVPGREQTLQASGPGSGGRFPTRRVSWSDFIPYTPA